MLNARRVAVVAAFALAAACGGGDGTGPSDPTPTNIVVNSGNNQSATVGTGVAIAPAVQVRDKKGRGVPGVQVTFSVASGGGSITGAVDTTDAGGIARVGSWTLGTASGANTLSALVTGLAPAGFTATAVAGAPAAMVFATAPGGTAQNGVAFTQQPVVQLRDQFGNNSPTAGVQVNVAILTGGGTLGGTATVASNASGVVTFTNLSITGTVGTRTLNFTATGLPALASGAVQLAAGAAATVSANSTTTLTGTAGAAVTPLPSVLVVDQSGNPVAGATVTFTAAVGEGTVTGGSPLTNASGIATVGSWTLGATTGSNNLSAQVGSLTPVVFTATVNPAAASLLDVVVQPSAGVASGSALAQQPVVRITDAFGNIIPGASNTITVTLQGPGATLGGTTSIAAVNGVATFTDLSLTGLAGSYTLAFAATGLTGDVSTAIALGAGPAAAIAVNAGNGQSATVNAAVTIPPSVLVTDLSGNPVAGVSVTFAVIAGGGSVTGPSQNTNAAGIATVGSWTLGTAAGSNSLSATSGTLSGSPVGFTATSTPAAAAQLLITTQPSTTTANGVALAQQPVVRITDAFGNPISQAGTLVTVAASTGGTIAAGATASTNASGVATFSGVILNGAAGSYTLNFSAPGLASATSTSVTLTAGAPALVSITTQPSATVANGSALAQQPAVQITDAGGNPSPLATNVIATLTGAPPNVLLGGTTTIATNGSGAGAFTNLSLSGAVGNYTLTLSATGLTAAVSSAITLTAGPAAVIAVNAGDGQSATVNSTLSTAPSVLVSDLSGNPVSGVAVTFVVASGGGSATGLTPVTGANGVATVGSWTLGTAAGANTLTASSGALSGSPVTFTATGTPAAASQLVITTPPSASATNGVALAQQPVVRVTDAFGNPVAQLGTIVSVAASAGGSIAAGGTAVTDAFGVATFSGVVLNGLVGSYTLSFSAPSLTGVTSAAIALAVGAPNTMSITTQPSATATNGAQFGQQPVLQLTDAGGNPSPTAGVTITAALTGSPANIALGGTTGVNSNASGVVSYTNLSLNGLVGSYTLTFSGTGFTSAVSSSIGLAAGAPAGIAAASPVSQAGRVGIAATSLPAVTVTDVSGNPVPNVSVTFQATAGGGSVSGATPATDALGQATVGGWTFGRTVVPNTVTATVGALPLVTFDATVTVQLVSLSAGSDHACALTVDGIPYCWGNNVAGGLGDSTLSPRPAPVPVAGGPIYGNIAAGRGFTCALNASGAAYCWGNNASGELGIGNNTPRNAPTAVSTGQTFGSIATQYIASSHHTCAIALSGSLFCWGDNSLGQFGRGNTTSANTPQAAGGAGTQYAAIAAGDKFTCGVRTSAAAFCWGINGSGQLGDNSKVQRLSPVAVQGGFNFSQVATSQIHSCGLTSGGLVYCWGDNTQGRLGQDPGTIVESLTPLQVPGLSNVIQLAAGTGHTCAVTSSQQVYCWGLNDFGQLGDGSGGIAGDFRFTPGLVSLPAGVSSFTTMTTGASFGCAVANTGAAYCWGEGGGGQLGDGTGSDSTLPVLVADP